jgi:hypothetical protein
MKAGEKQLVHVGDTASDETRCFGARYIVAYATIVAKMSRYLEISFIVANGLVAFPTLGLLSAV